MTVPANEYTVITAQSAATEIIIPIPWPYQNSLDNLLITQTEISTGETRDSDEGGFTITANFDFTEITVEQYNVFAGENTQYRVQRTLPVQQTYNLTEQGNLSSSALEQALDDNIRLMQDIRQNSSDIVITSVDSFKIANINTRRGKVFGFDEITGEPVYTGDINDIENISQAVTDAEDAAQQAIVAANLATEAANDAEAAVAEVAKANSAIIDPTINDDASQGYTENSLWTNTVDNTAFICVEPTTGAAIWQIIEVEVTSRVVTGAVENPVLEDKGNQIIKDGAASTTIVIQLDTTLDFPIGTKMQIIANGSGAVEIASDLGVLINGVDAVLFPLDAQYSQAFLQKLAADEWVLFGDINGGGGGIDFSTSEQNTGLKSVGGKDIFQKTIPIPALPSSSGGLNVAHGVSGIDLSSIYQVANGTGVDNGSLQLPLPYVDPSGSGAFNILLRFDTTNVIIEVGTDRSGYNGNVTIQYTKT